MAIALTAIALVGCGKTVDSIENDVEARLAERAPGTSAPFKDVDCAGYTEDHKPREGTRLNCEAFSTDDDIHDPNETVGEVTITVTSGDPTYRFRACKAATAPGPGPCC